MITPNQQLKALTPAFLDLFKNDTPDLDRFLRLVIDVLDPAAGYGPSICSGDGTFLPKGCGKTVVYQVATHKDHPVGYECPECGAVYLWSMCKGPKRAPQRVVLTSEAGSAIGTTKSVSDSGVTIVDNGTVVMPGKRTQ